MTSSSSADLEGVNSPAVFTSRSMFLKLALQEKKKKNEALFQGQGELKLKPSPRGVDEKEEGKEPRSCCVHEALFVSLPKTGVHHMSFISSWLFHDIRNSSPVKNNRCKIRSVYAAIRARALLE